MSYGERVKALVIGCGRVGSNVALQLAEEGWEVTGVDEKEEALTRLGENWRGGFVLGHGMDVDVLREAGIVEHGGEGYGLTPRGESLLEMFLPLHLWADEWAEALKGGTRGKRRQSTRHPES